MVDFKEAAWGRPFAPVIAVDGQAGSGKSTLSKGLSQLLGLPTLGTGLFYRAASLWMLENESRLLSDSTQLTEAISNLSIEIEEERTFLNGVDVTGRLRSSELQDILPKVSANPQIRSYLVGLQRSWVNAHGSSVVEGRDIGTVVFPTAYFKVFLRVSREIQVLRRPEERETIASRDLADSTRAVSPSTPAPDSVVFDTSNLSAQDVLDAVVTLLNARVEELLSDELGIERKGSKRL